MFQVCVNFVHSAYGSCNTFVCSFCTWFKKLWTDSDEIFKVSKAWVHLKPTYFEHCIQGKLPQKNQIILKFLTPRSVSTVWPWGTKLDSIIHLGRARFLQVDCTPYTKDWSSRGPKRFLPPNSHSYCLAKNGSIVASLGAGKVVGVDRDRQSKGVGRHRPSLGEFLTYSCAIMRYMNLHLHYITFTYSYHLT